MGWESTPRGNLRSNGNALGHSRRSSAESVSLSRSLIIGDKDNYLARRVDWRDSFSNRRKWLVRLIGLLAVMPVWGIAVKGRAGDELQGEQGRGEQGRGERGWGDRAWIDQMNRSSASQLYDRAIRSFQARRFDEAATTIQLAELRHAIDREAYPIDEVREAKRADISFAVTSVIASRTYPDMILSPEKLAKLTELIGRYQPVFEPEYVPGWVVLRQPDQARFQTIASAHRQEWLEDLKIMRRLQADVEYMRLARIYYRSEAEEGANEGAGKEPSSKSSMRKKQRDGMREQMRDVARKTDPKIDGWIPKPFIWMEFDEP